jgi:ParB family chromosome partitioning protein
MSVDTPKRKNLGKGLNALFGEQDDVPSAGEASKAAGAASGNPITQLPLDLLAPSPLQPRRHFDPIALDELASSIAEKGVLQPLLVRSNRSKPERYEIIAGERRWRAAQKAQLHEVPVHVIDLSDAEVLEVALIENLQRQDLSPVEEARGYRRLTDDFGHTQERVAEVVGKSRAHVANTMRLLALPDAVQALLDSKEISVGQARPLIGLNNAEALARKIVNRGLSARQVERMAKGFGSRSQASRRLKDADTAALEQNLEQATGYTVKITFDGKCGAVSVAYKNLEQLDDIVRRFSSGGRAKSKTSSSEEKFLADEMAGSIEDHSEPYPDPAADDLGADGVLRHDAENNN